jgi:hypothetical protein
LVFWCGEAGLETRSSLCVGAGTSLWQSRVRIFEWEPYRTRNAPDPVEVGCPVVLKNLHLDVTVPPHQKLEKGLRPDGDPLLVGRQPAGGRSPRHDLLLSRDLEILVVFWVLLLKKMWALKPF